MRKPGAVLTLIILTAIAAGIFVYPKGFGADWRPWRLGLDLVGGSHLIYQIDLKNVQGKDREAVVGGLRDVIERRVNLFGVGEPQVFVASQGEQSQLIVELAGVKEISEAIKQIGETPLLDFREVIQDATSTTFIPTSLTGRYVKGAELALNSTAQTPEVAISFNEEGATIFEELTGRNVGKPLAIFLDNALIEMPTVQQKISGGNAVITGKFTIREAQQLVERFNAGALPAPITLMNQQTISPNLGTDSLKKVIAAGIIGTLLVIAFMIFYYRLLGVFASLALIIYIALTLGVFKLGAFTLTLAGIAGFVLTIGMAVDANILIFERMKEELKRGLHRTAARTEGFRRAWPSIRDSNTSTIITAIILYFFTSSFVQGFALTLLIGVLVSMFSAITTTRFFLQVFLKDRKAN
ncbi:MAG: protein translocase subunit SecD [Candidatus Liptonbacteria bacterium]|nr:protein translocase subunit SecD [Candidatus Liptonbacteria bacterium]